MDELGDNYALLIKSYWAIPIEIHTPHMEDVTC